MFEGAPINFVSTATGHLAFAVTDLQLNALLPIMFQRVYASDRRDEDRGLGAGWSFIFDDRIRLEGDRAVMETGAGARIEFQYDGASGSYRLRRDETGAHQSFTVRDGATITEEIAGLTRTYTRTGDVYRLTQITDAHDNQINIRLDGRGNITRIAGVGGASLTLDWSNGQNARLVSVADNTGRRVHFDHAGGNLRRTFDPAGTEWTYHYANGRLTRAVDPMNRLLLRARYDRAGRATEAGDAVGMNNYEYDSSPISRRTIVTDPAGARTIFEHLEAGAFAAMSDDEGRTARIEYNAANRPVRVSDSLGDEMNLTYDSENRLLRQQGSDGTDKSFAYDERGRLVSTTEAGVRTDFVLDERGQIVGANGTDATRSYRATHNARGQTTSLQSGNRTVNFEYDARGNQTAFTYSDVGRFETERDAAGRAIMERLPSGLTHFNEYDARGFLSGQRDNRGRAVTIERDASGAPVGLVRADGRQMRAVRDAAGRVVQVNVQSWMGVGQISIKEPRHAATMTRIAERMRDYFAVASVQINMTTCAFHLIIGGLMILFAIVLAVMQRQAAAEIERLMR